MLLCWEKYTHQKALGNKNAGWKKASPEEISWVFCAGIKLPRDNLIPAARFYLYWPTGIKKKNKNRPAPVPAPQTLPSPLLSRKIKNIRNVHQDILCLRSSSSVLSNILALLVLEAATIPNILMIPTCEDFPFGMEGPLFMWRVRLFF